MADERRPGKGTAKQRKLQEAVHVLRQLGFGPRQSNDTAAYTLLACLDLSPQKSWAEASDPLIGITPMIEFIDRHYGVHYAPNTRETIRDEAVKHFVEAGLLVRNPDDAMRPTNSGRTVYQVEPSALKLIRCYGTLEWPTCLDAYLKSRKRILGELRRRRELSRIPVRLPSGKTVSISPGGQNPLIKQVIEVMCPRFAPGGVIVYIGDAENKFLHLQADYLKDLGVVVPPPAKMPDVIVHDAKQNWLLLIEAVTSHGPVNPKRRQELKKLFSGSKAGLVYVTAFLDRHAMVKYLDDISWETEVWIAESPSHLIHFNGERFLGPYDD